MARGRCPFKQQDVTRALRATVAAGVGVQRVEIDRDGKIVVVTGEATETEPVNEFDRWKARHADSA